MKIEDILSYIDIHTTNKQELTYSILDSDFLTALAYWVKFDKTETNWQKQVLSGFGSFPSLLVASDNKLRSSLNLSDQEIATMKVFHEATLRLLREGIYGYNVINQKEGLIQYLIALLSRESIEHFFVYFLDKNRHIIAENIQSTGTVNTASVYIREIARYAFKYEAEALILVHNHPTGIAFPSDSDKLLTRSIINAFKMIKIEIADHLIIGNGSYYSFAEQGLLNH